MPVVGMRLSVSCTSTASPSKPLRISVWPVANHTCTPLGTGTSIFAGAVIMAFTAEASAGPVIRIRVPVANSISIDPGVVDSVGGDPTPGEGTIATAENAGAARARRKLLPPAAQLTGVDTLGPRHFGRHRAWRDRRRDNPFLSALDQRRRRCTDVVTSTCVLVRTIPS